MTARTDPWPHRDTVVIWPRGDPRARAREHLLVHGGRRPHVAGVVLGDPRDLALGVERRDHRAVHVLLGAVQPERPAHDVETRRTASPSAQCLEEIAVRSHREPIALQIHPHRHVVDQAAADEERHVEAATVVADDDAGIAGQRPERPQQVGLRHRAHPLGQLAELDVGRGHDEDGDLLLVQLRVTVADRERDDLAEVRRQTHHLRLVPLVAIGVLGHRLRDRGGCLAQVGRRHGLDVEHDRVEQDVRDEIEPLVDELGRVVPGLARLHRPDVAHRQLELALVLVGLEQDLDVHARPQVLGHRHRAARVRPHLRGDRTRTIGQAQLEVRLARPRLSAANATNHRKRGLQPARIGAERRQILDQRILGRLGRRHADQSNPAMATR